MTLTTRYLGLTLAHPFIAGASPLTGHVDNARRLEDGGCAGIVMHSLFAEQIPETTLSHIPALARAMQELSSSVTHFKRPARFPSGPDEYLEQLRTTKAAVSIPVIGSLNGAGTDGWLTYARSMEQAGADALEVNVYYLPMGTRDSSFDIENQIESVLREVKRLVHIPVAVKLLPFYTAFASLGARLDAAGADGLVLFNRFYHADVDIETLEVVPNLHLSTSSELLLRLHWLAILSGDIRASLAVSGGVHTVVDGIKALLSGAHAVQMVSAVLQQGPQHFREMEHGLRYWMTRHGHDSIDAFRGLLNLAQRSDLRHLERANYMRVLQSWAG